MAVDTEAAVAIEIVDRVAINRLSRRPILRRAAVYGLRSTVDYGDNRDYR